MKDEGNAQDMIEPGQTWGIDCFRPEDAQGVRKLFLLVYGEGHPVRTYLEPERLIEENTSGRIISSVARTPKGEIVGHCALFCTAPYDRIYEGGAGAVHPNYRGGKGIFSSLGAYLQDVAAKAFGVEGIYGEPVCNHLFSQKMVASLGWITQAAEVDLMPAEAYDKERSATGRVTCLFDFRTLKPKTHTVYLPLTYEEPLQFVYEGLDDERNLARAEEDWLPNTSTKINVQVFDFAKVARLAVHEAGKDFDNAFDEEEKRLRAKEVVVIEVWLKLSWPWINRMVNSLRERGYFLGGILPRWFDVDGLLMQKIFGPPNWKGIQLNSERAKKLLEFVKADWAKGREGL
jgi:hypothetical protein